MQKLERYEYCTSTIAINRKRMLAETKFRANEEVIAETYYTNGIEKCYDCYNRFVDLEGNYIK